jgi:hypothetical protein
MKEELKTLQLFTINTLKLSWKLFTKDNEFQA